MQLSSVQIPAEEDIREQENLKKDEERKLFAGLVRMPAEAAAGQEALLL